MFVLWNYGVAIGWHTRKCPNSIGDNFLQMLRYNNIYNNIIHNIVLHQYVSTNYVSYDHKLVCMANDK